MGKAYTSCVLIVLSVVGYIASIPTVLSALDALSGSSSNATVYPSNSPIWSVPVADSGPSPLAVHEPSAYGHTRLLLLVSQVVLVAAIAVFYLWARRSAEVAEKGRSIARRSFVPIAGWRMAGAGFVELFQSLMRRRLTALEQIAVRLWFIGLFVVLALTGFADIPGFGSGGAIDGTSVGAMRSALDTAVAAGIAGLVFALLSLGLVVWALAAAPEPSTLREISVPSEV